MNGEADMIRTCACSFLLVCSALTHAAGVSDTARQIAEAADVKGGLVVHVGCGDGSLTAALRLNDGYLVHGVDQYPASVAKARKHILSRDLYGPVSVDTFDGERLPYVDGTVNLVVVSRVPPSPGDSGVASACRVSGEEIARVLAPRGVAVLPKQSGTAPTGLSALDTRHAALDTFRKPVPPEIDDWTHFLYDASNNPVAHDRAVAAPRGLRWIDGPLWSRSHEYDASLCAMVSSQGRLFSIFDEGPTGIIDARIPDRWALIARDAFNGVVLWKKPIADWGWKAWRPNMKDMNWRRMRSYRCASPLAVPRRLVAVGDRVFVTLGYRAPVTALDAATGRTLATYEGSEHTDEILHRNGRLLLCIRRPQRQTTIMAADAETGRTLWRYDQPGVVPLTLASTDRGVFCCIGKAVVCLDSTSGHERWRAPLPGAGAPLAVYDGVVLCKGKKHLVGLAAGDGKELWRLPAPRGFSIANPADLFVVDGLVWCGRGQDVNSVTGYNPRTGKPVRTVDFGPLLTRGHHARCYRSKATDNYLFLPKRAVELIDLHGDNHSRHNWVRGGCRYGVLPCNGLLYSTPHPCFCYAGVKLGGFMALAPESQWGVGSGQRAARLKKGASYGQIPDPADPSDPSDWPMYRHDAGRSGCVTTDVKWPVRAAWTRPLGGKLTQPVVVGDRLFVARLDAGQVCCLDAATGEPVWDFFCGGRVDSSPTYYRGCLLFGSADGHVYCLRASDGALVWRFRAAPVDRRVVAFGRLESVWPVHGSVLVLGDTAYFACGRSSFLDGGIALYGLDARTGEKRCETRIDGPHPEVSASDEAAYAMEGTKSDILVSDGERIYLFHNVFNKRLEKQPAPVLGEPGVRNLGERDFGEHLFSNAGFLDDSWFSRNFWMLGDRWTAFNFGHQAPKAGQLVVFDEETAYAVKCFARRNMLSPLFFPGTDGYFLVADRRDTRAVLVNPREKGEFIQWLPQDGKLQKCWNLDVGFARGTQPEWISNVPVRIRAMVCAGSALYAAGPPDQCEPDDPMAAFEGRLGSVLLAIDTTDGRKLGEHKLEAPPVFDGLIAARGRLYLATNDGGILCMESEEQKR